MYWVRFPCLVKVDTLARAEDQGHFGLRPRLTSAAADICAWKRLCWFNVKTTLAIADPAPSLFFRGFAGGNFHPVGNHEGAIEANAELADKIRILLGVSGELRKEVLGSGSSNGAEMRDQVL